MKFSSRITAALVISILCTLTLLHSVYASPAIANGNLFIRGVKHLFAIGK